MNERQQQITDNHLNNRCEIVTSRDPNGRARSCACTVQTLAAKRVAADDAAVVHFHINGEERSRLQQLSLSHGRRNGYENAETARRVLAIAHSTMSGTFARLAPSDITILALVSELDVAERMGSS